MIWLSVLFGAAVGFSLGLTGGGGAIFAVPLLVYGLGIPTREAVGASLVTVGAAALVGFIGRARRQLVEFPTGLLFALAGMVGAPAGSWLSARTPEALLLSLFAVLMLVIAVRMWLKAGQAAGGLSVISRADDAGPTCQRDPEGKLRITSQCALVLAAVGLVSGVLAGLFGVGGGFIIVPALVTFAGMGIQRAIGTSLLVIALVSVSGTTSYLLAGGTIDQSVVWPFIAGSLGGLMAGSALAQRMAGTTLQRVFAVAIVLVALFVIARTVAAT